MEQQIVIPKNLKEVCSEVSVLYMSDIRPGIVLFYNMYLTPYFLACNNGWRSYTFHRHAEKNYSIGFRNGEYGGRYRTIHSGWSTNQSRTRGARWKLTLSQMTTYLVRSGPPLCSPGMRIPCSVSRIVMRRAVL